MVSIILYVIMSKNTGQITIKQKKIYVSPQKFTAFLFQNYLQNYYKMLSYSRLNIQMMI